MATLLFISLFLVLFGATTFFWAYFLGMGLRWAKVPDVSKRRLALATCLVLVFDLILRVLAKLVLTTKLVPVMVLGIAFLIAGLLVPCCVIMRVFKSGFLRSLQAWLLTLIPEAFAIVLLVVVIRPFVFEAFTNPTNSMAPTLLGSHWRGTCVACGDFAYCTPLPEFEDSQEFSWMICESNFHISQPTSRENRVFSGDRIIVAKFLHPRRWDLIVFQLPENPSIFYVKRLVGLPGEEITIRDGAVWANGNRLVVPESIRGIKYLAKIDGFGVLWGSPERPAKLADDEYFALGDFSLVARDSRLGSRGHRVILRLRFQNPISAVW